MSSRAQSLKCGVVGAGIAGLAAALALRRAGHEVEIFEKSQFKHEIGAAITLTPNANLILDRWGFDTEQAKGADRLQLKHLDPKTLQLKAFNDFRGIKEKFGHSINAFHRVDLHQTLWDLMLSRDQPGPIPTLRLASEVSSIKCEAGIITLEDGKEIQKDLVVIADGFRSQFVENITGKSMPIMKSGKSTYRTLIPVERLMSDPLVRPIFEDKLSTHLGCFDMKTGVALICYPCRKNEVMNVAVFHSTREDQKDHDDWNSPATVDDVVEQLNAGDWNPAWEAFIKLADHMNCYTIGVRDVLPTMVGGKAVLIGDAAHHMQPNFAQGGCTAIEDAAAFELFFSSVNFNAASDSVEKRLKLWNEFRTPRDYVTQLMSNARFYNRPVEQSMKRVQQYWTGPIPADSTRGWGEDVQDFFWRYDVFAEAEKALKYKDAEGGIPEGVIEHFGLKAGT